MSLISRDLATLNREFEIEWKPEEGVAIDFPERALLRKQKWEKSKTANKRECASLTKR